MGVHNNLNLVEVKVPLLRAGTAPDTQTDHLGNFAQDAWCSCMVVMGAKKLSVNTQPLSVDRAIYLFRTTPAILKYHMFDLYYHVIAINSHDTLFCGICYF